MRNKKLRMRKFMIFGIAFFIGLMVVSMLSGNEAKEKLIIVKGELDISKKLDTQFASFDVIEITKNESQKLGDSVVRELEDLVGMRTAIELPIGSPIPKSLLLDESDKAGEFASKMPEYRTYYRFVGGVAQLPPGVGVGDKIDVGVLYEENKERIINIFMRDIVVGSVENADILVDVTQVEHYQLTLAALEGQFVLQLPGRKSVETKCSELTYEELGEVECYYEDSAPRKITVDEIRELMKNGAEKRVEPIREETDEVDGEVITESEVITEEEEETIQDSPVASPSETDTNPDVEEEEEDIETVQEQDEVETEEEKRRKRESLINSFNN